MYRLHFLFSCHYQIPCLSKYVLRSVDLWGRKCVKTALFVAPPRAFPLSLLRVSRTSLPTNLLHLLVRHDIQCWATVLNRGFDLEDPFYTSRLQIIPLFCAKPAESSCSVADRTDLIVVEGVMHGDVSLHGDGDGHEDGARHGDHVPGIQHVLFVYGRNVGSSVQSHH